MVAQSVWTPEYTTDVIWAFQRLATKGEQVKRALSPEARKQLETVQAWLKQMAALRQQYAGDIPSERVPHWPLGRREALQLQQTLADLRANQAASQGKQSTRPSLIQRILDPAGHLTQNLRQVTYSSWLIGIALVALVAFDVLSMLVWTDLSRRRMEAINLGSLALILAIWAYHHFATIIPHVHAIFSHLAIHHHRSI